MGVVAGVVIAIYAIFFGSTDEDRIRELLERLERAVAVHSDETNVIVRGARVRKAFKEIFSKDVRFQVPDFQSAGQSRRALVGLATQAPRLYRNATVDLGGLSVKVDEKGESSTAFGQAVVVGVRQNGTAERDSRTISLRLDKMDGDWRIVQVDVSPRTNNID